MQKLIKDGIRGDDKSLEELKDLIDELADKGDMRLNLSGSITSLNMLEEAKNRARSLSAPQVIVEPKKIRSAPPPPLEKSSLYNKRKPPMPPNSR